MKKFKYKGYTYEMIIRPWKKGNNRFEVIRWKTGFRNFWERISYNEFLKLKQQDNDRRQKQV